MAKHQLDIRGEICPYTLMSTKKRVAELEVGDLLELWIDNFEATETIPNWAKNAGHELVETQEDQGSWKLTLKKCK
ncbi:MAG: sulfurtransferase TusA family protein [Candidatus Bipolaricaulia bacterium]